jgi:hypothetical protein
LAELVAAIGATSQRIVSDVGGYGVLVGVLVGSDVGGLVGVLVGGHETGQGWSVTAWWVFEWQIMTDSRAGPC